MRERFGSNKGGYPRPWRKLSFPGKMFMKNVTTNEVNGEIPLCNDNNNSKRFPRGGSLLLMIHPPAPVRKEKTVH